MDLFELIKTGGDLPENIKDVRIKKDGNNLAMYYMVYRKEYPPK